MSETPEYRNIFTCQVTPEGKLQPVDAGRWVGTMQRFLGKRVTVTVSRERKVRTDAQNRWYWTMLVPVFSEWTGYEKDEAHEVLKGMFLKEERQLPTGKTVEYVRSTADLDVQEFKAYCDRAVRFLAENGWNLPGPGEEIAV